MLRYFLVQCSITSRVKKSIFFLTLPVSYSRYMFPSVRRQYLWVVQTARNKKHTKVYDFLHQLFSFVFSLRRSLLLICEILGVVITSAKMNVSSPATAIHSILEPCKLEMLHKSLLITSDSNAGRPT